MLTRSLLITALIGLTGLQAGPQLSVLVTVVPPANGPLRDLSTADFIVRESGATRQVLKAARAREPLHISVLIDATQRSSGSTNLVQDLRIALASFVRTVRDVEPSAKFSLTEVTSGSDLRAGFDTPAEELSAVIEKLYPINTSGGTIMLETIGQTARMLTDKPSPRRCIVVIDFSAGELRAQNTMKKVVDLLQPSGATVWAVSTRPMRQSNSAREEGLNILTKITGGARYTALETTGLEAQLKKIADALTSQYIVTFARPKDGPPVDMQMETTAGAKVLPSPMVR